MNLKLTYNPRDPRDFPHWRFETIDFEYDPASQSVWSYYKADGPPCYTFQALSDLADMRESLRGLFASELRAAAPVRYYAMASRRPGVFNLGGDLGMFARAIRDGQREMLHAYGQIAIDVLYGHATAFGLPIVTIAVVAGQALGGGFEGALAQDYLLAEETAKIGVPEVAFNSFPGMGAVSLLTRRLGMARAEEIIATGAIYSGRQMFELGVADLIAPDGEAHSRALGWMEEGGEERFARRLAMAAARRRCFPISYEELIRIVELWADCSGNVSTQDVRYMERLVAAQRRMAVA